MALLRTKEVRAMDAEAREKKLKELRDELMHERGVAAMGGAPPNPGKIRALRKNIARIYTVQSEETKLAGRSAAHKETPTEGEKATEEAGAR
jgi:large subunit ribosomal protein L29